MTRKASIWIALPIALVAFASCGTDKQVSPVETSLAIAPSAQATTRAIELRHRFDLRAAGTVRFERSGDEVRTFLGTTAAVVTLANVVLPSRAGGRTRIEDQGSKMVAWFALRNATDSALAIGDGMAVYLGGYSAGGTAADVMQRVHADGTEDYVAFASRPAHEELTYDLDVSQAAGLRLVEDQLELLDETGTPRLRVSRPFVVDAYGHHHDASLTVTACAYDVSPAPPWGRAVVPPGAKTCAVHVAWSGVDYPALVDPIWNATSTPAYAREEHTSTALVNGDVLVVGGKDGTTRLATAEVYNSTTGVWSGVGSLTTGGRDRHAAVRLANGNVLITGGENAGYLPTAEIYSGGAFAATGSMNVGRSNHTATLLNNNQVLIAGGYAPGVPVSGPVATAELFNGSAFTYTGSMGGKRYLHTATRLGNGNVLIAGGGGGGGSGGATAELFTGAGFTPTGSMKTGRQEHTATLLPSGAVLMVGGTTANMTAELYSGGTFTDTGPALSFRLRHTATLLDSGKVLVTHGYGTVPAAELYDPPPVGTFTNGATIKVQREFARASMLTDGRILVTGGGVKSAERYDVLAAGVTCVTKDDCRSGVCEDTFCCATACGGTCKTCAPTTGACTTVTNADDPNTCAVTSTCNGQGACKLLQGQACSLSSSCLSGNCADGVCCNAPCNGGCDVCDATGTCKVLANGATGANPSCGGFVCDGVNGQCPGNCTSDASCAASQYCSANGTCQPKKQKAAACNPAVDCKTADCGMCEVACVDGVCCDTACTGLCQACRASLKQNGADGACGPAKEGTNPHNDTCPVDPQSTCKQDGKCSGSGGCRAFYPAGTSCGVSQCNAGTNKASGFICNGAGTCGNDTVGVSCFDYVCDAATGSCPNACATDAQCSPGAYCSAGSCLPKAANGGSCTEERQCATGICVDGFCCNAACEGQCEACDVVGAEGTCAPLTGAPHNERPRCSAGDAEQPCATATCDGTTRDACAGFVGPEVRCGKATCANGSATTAGNCRKGACVTSSSVPCGAYACGETACKTTCESKDDCAAGNLCDTTTKRCIAQATCDGDHTTTGANGQKQDCTPFKCQPDGTCRQTCASIDDCVAPTACDPSGKCVLPPATDGGDSGGCSMSASRTSPALPLDVLAALVALAVIARRRPARAA